MSEMAGRVEMPEGRVIAIEDLQRVQLEPGDVLIVRCSKEMTMEEIDWSQRFLGEVFPGNRVIVLDGRVESINVVRPGGG